MVKNFKNKAQKNLSALSTQTEEEEDIDNIQNKEGVPEDSEKVSKKKVSESKEA